MASKRVKDICAIARKLQDMYESQWMGGAFSLALRDTERDERQHRGGYGPEVHAYRSSTKEAALCFVARAIVTAKRTPPRSWEALNGASWRLYGGILAERIRQSYGNTLGLTKAERELAASFSYVDDIAPKGVDL